MAELADAHGSGPCEGNFMGVQVPSSAPTSPASAGEVFVLPGGCDFAGFHPRPDSFFRPPAACHDLSFHAEKYMVRAFSVAMYTALW